MIKLIINGIIHEFFIAAKLLLPGKKFLNNNAVVKSVTDNSVTTTLDVNDPDYEYEVKVTKVKKKK